MAASHVTVRLPTRGQQICKLTTKIIELVNPGEILMLKRFMVLQVSLLYRKLSLLCYFSSYFSILRLKTLFPFSSHRPCLSYNQLPNTSQVVPTSFPPAIIIAFVRLSLPRIFIFLLLLHTIHPLYSRIHIFLNTLYSLPFRPKLLLNFLRDLFFCFCFQPVRLGR